jgi:hypothetical protein
LISVEIYSENISSVPYEYLSLQTFFLGIRRKVKSKGGKADFLGFQIPKNPTNPEKSRKIPKNPEKSRKIPKSKSVILF